MTDFCFARKVTAPSKAPFPCEAPLLVQSGYFEGSLLAAVHRALAVEDSAALIGLALAAAGLAVHELGGPASSDAIASLLIGILLGATAVGLARPLADLLIGRSIRPERLELARRTLEASPAVDEIRQLYAVHVAPQDVVLAAKVHPSGDLSVDQLARSMDRLDAQLRSELPEVGEVFIDVTQHSGRDTRD